MSLTIKQIRAAESDAELQHLLQRELNALFPPEVRRDLPVFLSRLEAAPVGLRAMAVTYGLDVSLAMDDLAWHFLNHPDQDLAEITLFGLRELEAVEAAVLFEQAFAVVKPHWPALLELVGTRTDDARVIHDWLVARGIQSVIDPLNQRFWKLLQPWPQEGLMHYWMEYARKHPERCVTAP